MRQIMIEILHNLSDEFWDKAKISALGCLENYINENSNHDLLLENTTITDFVFEKERQSLIFWDSGNKTFILRTTYNIMFIQERKKIGYYSLDMNDKNEVVDDWLVFN
jgi:hypothetical protein